MILVKIHRSGDSAVVCLCDSNLIGRKFSEGDLNLEVSKRFYEGKEMEKEMMAGILKECKNLNIVGKKSIEFALKCKKINKRNIIKIKNIPHAIVV